MKNNFKRFIVLAAAAGILPVFSVRGFNSYAEETVNELSPEEALEFAENDTGISVVGCGRSVRNVEIPSEIDGVPVTDIGSKAFFACTNLKSVVIPDTVTVIGANAFCECVELAEVIIPESVEVIDEYAFYNCNNLTSVVIPEGVTTIDWSAFAQCSNLTDVSLPSTIEYIGYNSFADTPWLKSVYKENSMFIHNNILFSAKETEWKPNIPGGVEKIADSAFESSEYLKRVTMPDSLTYIGRSAFAECNYLNKVNFSRNITYIGEAAFSDCPALKTIQLPESLTEISPCTFEYCSSLESMVFHKNIKYIGQKALSSCASLRFVTIENPDCEIYDANNTFSNDYTDDFIFTGTIYGHENSTAQAYAEKYDMNFAVIGDLNGDCQFTVADLVCAEKYLLGSGGLPDWKAGDRNNDNEFDVYDMVLLRRHLVV